MSITTMLEGHHHGIGRLDILSKMLARCCVWKMGDRKLNYIKQEVVYLRGQEAARPVGCSEHWQLGGVGLAKQSYDFRVHCLPPVQPALPHHGHYAAQLAINIYRMIPTVPSTFPS